MTPFHGQHYRLDDNIYKYFKYERHSAKMYFFENEEFWQEEIVDERKIAGLEYLKVFLPDGTGNLGNFSYLLILDQLKKGNINAKELGSKL